MIDSPGAMVPVSWYRFARLSAGVLLLLAALGGCAAMVPQTMDLRSAWPDGVPDRVEMVEVPFFPQRDYQCGPAALATALVHVGAPVTPDDLVQRVYLPARQGGLQVEMLAAPRRHSLVSYQLAPRLDHLLREVAAGNPVIVLQDIGPGFITKWHYAVVVGFNYAAGELYLRSGETRRLAIPFTIFEYTWKKGDYWAMVVMQPGRTPVTAEASAHLRAIAAMERVADARAALSAYATHLERWPDDLGAAVGLANQHHARGELKNAEAILRRAAEQRADSVVVLNNLAQTLSDQGRQAEALTLIERAAQMDSPFAAAVRETRTLILQRTEKGK